MTFPKYLGAMPMFPEDNPTIDLLVYANMNREVLVEVMKQTIKQNQ